MGHADADTDGTGTGTETAVKPRVDVAEENRSGLPRARPPCGPGAGAENPNPADRRPRRLVDPARRMDARTGMIAYWPWWGGAIGLAAVTIFYTVATGRSLGLSAAWDRVLHWREERELERLDEAFADDDVFAEALALATAEEFGGSQTPSALATAPAPLLPEQPPADNPRGPVPLATHAALLISVFVGGLIAAISSGRFELRFDMGDAFTSIVTDNPIAMLVTLFVGGLMVGFGTRLAGGCSSGHGLSGCGRMRPVSLVATAVFFGTAVVVSFLLWKVI
jgi:hypothetical protein